MRYALRIGIILLAVSCLALAQGDEGRIVGTITDSTGSVVVGAQVTITSVATNASRVLISNKVGDYLAPALKPGSYIVSAEAPGFKKAVSQSVLVE